jgi:hemolysin activation/secretion protein
MSLGGARGVRAYPQGEASGDSALLGQLELRYQYKELTPYVFYDLGRTTINTRQWIAGDNTRNIAGGGIGLKAAYQEWSADLSLAWRASHSVPQSDTRDDSPRIWANVSYSF